MLDVAKQRLDATVLIPETDNDNQPLRKRAVAAVMSLQNIRKRQAAIESATSNERFACRAEEFDRDDYLFACANGVINLKTGEFRPGRREDMISKASAVKFDKNASCERWQKFLSEIFEGKAHLIDFIQHAAGYSLTGLTREEIFFILYGSGRNGKGTLMRVLLALLGAYGLNTPFSTLVAERYESRGPRNDIAAFAGRRLVASQEPREGVRLDEALIKSLTGGDLITARFLHKENFSFRPTWKIWIATNHKPEIRGSDDGIWSRPKLIPFNVSFEGKEDRNLKDDLLKPEELSGIFNWAIKGCQDYLQHGLQYPDEVNAATKEYKNESDFIERFLAERCLRGQGQTQARELYQEFLAWARDSREPEIKETAFGLRMREKGHPSEYDSKSRKVYYGIALRPKDKDGNPTDCQEKSSSARADDY